jgi:hypothetical protein
MAFLCAALPVPTGVCWAPPTRELAFEQAKRADAEIAAGKYRGPLHGIPWGCATKAAILPRPAAWAAAVTAGSLSGPTIFQVGPMLNGSSFNR